MEGVRPKKPEGASRLGFNDELWRIVELCWREDCNARPSIDDILSCLTYTATQNQTVLLLQDTLKNIIAYLDDDIQSLKAVSATCHSWHLSAIPRLHRTLVLKEPRLDPTNGGFKPLEKLHKMGALPSVEKLWIQTGLLFDFCLRPAPDSWLSPREFDRQTLRYFSALTTVQHLQIEGFDLSKFMPDVERYFGHFAPTLRSISLTISSGTQRQLLYFLALFPNLDDIDIGFYLTTDSDSAIAANRDSDVAVPFSVHGLRGQLQLSRFPSETVSRDMITLFGGLRFQRMDLFCVEGARLLLGACADTLQTVKVYPAIPNSAEPTLTPMCSY